MPDVEVTAVTANLYTNNKRVEDARRRLRRLRATVIGVQEARNHVSWLRGTMPAFDVFSPPDHWGANTSIMLRKHATEYHGHGFQRLTDRIEGIGAGYGSPRWLTWVDFAIDGEEFTAMSGHAPVVSRKETPNPQSRVGREAVRYHRGYYALAEAKRETGRHVILLADLNDAPFKGVAPWEWRPTERLGKEGFPGHVRNDVDYVAWSKGLKPEEPPVIVPDRETGSDHDWIAQRLRVA